MFEFVIALKYLLPKKRALSTALISLLSVFVISLVVWLVLVFLSVTTGIEKNWLQKLTSLNAPVRIAPTNSYFTSYYYQIDKLSSSSGYSFKTLGEKAESKLSDPYSPEQDMELPSGLTPPLLDPSGHPKDLVKGVLLSLEAMKKEFPGLLYEDYEMSGALMRLALARPQQISALADEKTSFLSQMSYIISFAAKNPSLPSLIIKPKIQDLNNLLYQLGKASDEMQKDAPQEIVPISDETLHTRLQAFFQHLAIKKIRTGSHFLLPPKLLSEGSYEAYAKKDLSGVKRLFISLEKKSMMRGLIPGTLHNKQGNLLFQTSEGDSLPVAETIPIFLEEPAVWQARLLPESLPGARSLGQLRLQVTGTIQGKNSTGLIPFQNLLLEEAEPRLHFARIPSLEPLWPYFYENGNQNLACALPHLEESSGILLPKTYQDSGVLAGDKGYLSYLASSGFSTQEQRLPFFVAGFYDPGIMPVGNRCLLVPQEITRTINASSTAFSPDGTPNNGILVWMKNSKDAPLLKTRLQEQLAQNELLPFFQVATYKEYEFSKDLMQQFQSDRTLFTLIAMIIIIVACCNIISLLVLLVNDKKKEIAILSAMGAKKESIALIFGFCGIVTGTASSLIGVSAAILTLKHLDILVAFLSSLQGHAAFQTAFFGDSLPNELSSEALLFVLIATPIISLLAGLIPAIKAAKLHASSILRGE